MRIRMGKPVALMMASTLLAMSIPLSAFAESSHSCCEGQTAPDQAFTQSPSPSWNDDEPDVSSQVSTDAVFDKTKVLTETESQNSSEPVHSTASDPKSESQETSTVAEKTELEAESSKASESKTESDSIASELPSELPSEPKKLAAAEARLNDEKKADSKEGRPEGSSETTATGTPSQGGVLDLEDVLGSDDVEDLSIAENDNGVTDANPYEEGMIVGNAFIVERDGILIVDNDYDVTQEKEYAWEKFEDKPGLTKIEAGARLPVQVVTALSSKTAKVNDAVEARLKHDITIGGKPIAKAGDRVIGHVGSCMRARRILHAELSKNRWMRANGCIGIQFDEIITSDGEHLPLIAKPARQPTIIKNKNEGRVLGVNAQGEVASPLSTQLKHQAAHLAIRGAASAGGIFSMGIVPAAYGVVGAINPSFAFLQPVGKNVPHRRLKGFAMGVVSGLPGGFLIADTIIRGKEAEIKPGDEFLVEFKQDFTGEAATSASLIPGSEQKVRGEVVEEKK